MNTVQNFDKKLIAFARNHYSLIARIALFVIFFYFGFLKLLGLSPADTLAEKFATTMGVGNYFDFLYLGLAFIECVIGILFLLPRFTRIAIGIMAIHMLIVSAPLLLDVSAVWSRPFVPNLEGQYIIKNAALVALALGLVAQTTPLSRDKR